MIGRPSQTKERKETEGSGAPLRAPAISLPKGGGAIRGIGEKFAANPVTGTGSMTVPIATSPGRSGFGPQLSLSYDSGAGNGPFGFGWSLSLPAITRKTDKGLPQYWDAEESDIFILSGAEDLVPVLVKTGGHWQRDSRVRTVGDTNYHIQRYRPRIEGLFARIERWSNQADPSDTFWRSISKDNIATWYGKSEESRIADPADATRIFSWLICESYDDKGNVIIYRYREENGDGVELSQAHERNRGETTDKLRSANRYLKRIRYGNHQPYLPKLVETEPWPAPLGATELDGSKNWFFEVVFDYGEHGTNIPSPNDSGIWDLRNDPFSTYRSGFEVRTYRLCQRVLMFHHFPDEADVGANCLVRSTDFTYSYEDNEPDPRDPIFSFLLSVTQSGYKRQGDGTYLKKSLPPLEFEYTQPIIDEEIREVDPKSLENLPYGLDNGRYQWVDLDGEGLSGILTEQAEGWFYKRNLSPFKPPQETGPETVTARFAPIERVAQKPSLAALSGGRQQFLDLAGDGQVDLVELEGPTPGFYERTEDERWETFVPFTSLPNLAWDNPNLKFVDLTGDGHADILISEDEVFCWHPSLAEAGFGPPERVRKALDEEKGPKLVLADGTQSIYLSDMSGDGLTDLVRIRNGEVCYWPNLGYGRFGAKVTMDNAPWFDAPDLFDQRRIRLADIDGSGVTDILYLSRRGVQVYFNQSGNSWSAPTYLTNVPATDNIKSVTVVDLLGNGTACLVWSSPLSSDVRQPMRYLALMGQPKSDDPLSGQKPHLLVTTKNNLGAETHMQYAPSTKFYLADKLAGKPWITRLPFPVHVVERVEIHDHISGNRFVTRYAYHHGYFDGPEREFRGFGMVEQLDTEEFAALTASGALPATTNVDESSHVPPVLTRTWFHTGAFLDETRISKQFEHEYYREGDPSESLTGLTDEQLRALLLDDTLLPDTLRLADGTRTPYALSTAEVLEACRALKGAILRQEIYALDGTDEADRPYSTSERNYTIELLQPRDGNKHAVFFTHAREQVDFHYERKLLDVNGRKRADPRVSHAMTLEVDAFGNALRSVAIGYRRRDLPGVDGPEQQQTHVTLTVNRFVNRPDELDWYRIGLPVETRTYEIVKPPAPTITDTRIDLFGFEAIAALTADLFPLVQLEPGAAKLWPYAKWDWHRNAANAPPDTRLRLIEHVRTVYRRDDLTGPLDLEEIESLALPFESYKLAFTPDLAQQIFVNSGKLTVAELNGVLADEGKYVHSEGDANWWIPSGQMFYSPGSTDIAAVELKHARAHFFLPHRFQDPFGNNTFVEYDKGPSNVKYNLLVALTRDAVGNEVKAQNDYRVLQPRLMTDPNGNHTEVAFDALGLVAGTAVMGKRGQNLGDTMTGFAADLTETQVRGFHDAGDPHTLAADLLKDATTRIIYDLERFKNTGQPVYAATLARETHASDPGGGQTKIQISFSYSDGFGREIQKKIQAEPGPLVEGGPTVSPRWVGSGWTIFNNKGKPVRQYEPFFSQLPEKRHRFEFGAQVGVSPILFYDPVERVVATLHLNHSWEKVVFDPWQQTTYDVNDTVTFDPKIDEDVSGFFTRLPEAEYLPTWQQARINKPPGDPERQAADKAAQHADTPTTAHFDTLGRPFLTIAHNRLPLPPGEGGGEGADEFYATRTVLDIEGNQREVIDARDRTVMRYDYDLLGNRIHQASMEAGERWMLSDVTGKPIRAWDSRGHQFKTDYDALHRPVRQFVRGTDATQSDPRTVNRDVLFEKTEYGEGQPNDKTLNLRTRVFKHFDSAGVVTSMGRNLTTDQDEAYDFKGNLLRGSRTLADDYRKLYDWQTDTIQPAWETFSSSTTYDALNRPTAVTTPDKSVYRPSYNEANLLDKVDVNLRGADSATPFVTNIDYNAKGQRTRIDYGTRDGKVISTSYAYDRQTFRLTHLYTRRGVDPLTRESVAFTDDCDNPHPPPTTIAAPENPPQGKACGLQNLHYTYDPAGNITHIRDDAQQTIFFRNQRVEPSADYTYDAIYRLIEATGREHLGQNAAGTRLPPSSMSYNDKPRVGLLHPGDGKAMGTYVQQYVYDELGNFKEVRHRGTDPANTGWTRTYDYLETSVLEANRQSNRLTRTRIGNDAETYSTNGDGYDAHGNMLRMPQLQIMQWDFQDQLLMTQRQKVNDEDEEGVQRQGERTHYVYDAAGQRVRKVTELAHGNLKDERIYLGGFEIYRHHTGANAGLVRESLHIMDDKQRIALVETRNDVNDGTAKQLIRYQFGNHLGSASLELDDHAVVISYEEYYPYGSTSYQAVNKDIKAAAKRYRYTGKERDEESGLYYHGARYYAPWLGRWVSCDRVELLANRYVYCSNNPLRFRDPNGKWEVEMHFAGTYLSARLTPGVSHGDALRAAIANQVLDDLGYASRTASRPPSTSAPGTIAIALFTANQKLMHRARTSHGLTITRDESLSVAKMGIAYDNPILLGYGLHTAQDLLPHASTVDRPTFGHPDWLNQDYSLSKPWLTDADKTFRNPTKALATFETTRQLWWQYSGNVGHAPNLTQSQLKLVSQFIFARDWNEMMTAFRSALGNAGVPQNEILEAETYLKNQQLRITKWEQLSQTGQGLQAGQTAATLWDAIQQGRNTNFISRKALNLIPYLKGLPQMPTDKRFEEETQKNVEIRNRSRERKRYWENKDVFP